MNSPEKLSKIKRNLRTATAVGAAVLSANLANPVSSEAVNNSAEPAVINIGKPVNKRSEAYTNKLIEKYEHKLDNKLHNGHLKDFKSDEIVIYNTKSDTTYNAKTGVSEHHHIIYHPIKVPGFNWVFNLQHSGDPSKLHNWHVVALSHAEMKSVSDIHLPDKKGVVSSPLKIDPISQLPSAEFSYGNSSRTEIVAISQPFNNHSYTA